MYTNVKGLVIRSVDYRESDKILTLLTDGLGKITVKARGVRNRRSKSGVASQLFAWSDMTVYQKQGRYTLTESQLIESFPGLQKGLEGVALAAYFAELLSTEAEESPPHPEVLRLALNGLYALAKGLYPPEQIKAAFELRYMALSGYRPQLERCGLCGEMLEEGGFDLSGGRVLCCNCGEGLPLDKTALAAARYITTAPVSRVFSFQIGEESRALLYQMSEEYLLYCMERNFKTLGFYRAVTVL